MLVMKKRVFMLAVAVLGLLLTGSKAECATRAGGVQLVPPYRPYFYNYPHAIPPDYVFRTGRVFSPQNMKGGAWDKFLTLFGEKELETEEFAPAKAAALQRIIGKLGKALVTNAEEDLRDEYTVTVSTFVNLNNLYSTSSLGRYFGEQMIGELQKEGIGVIDVRKTPGIMVSLRQGEYGLSRDMDELSFMHHAQAMVVGTYSVTDTELFVNARILRNDDGLVLSTASLVLPIDSLVGRLLADESVPEGHGASVSLRAFPEAEQ